MTFWDGTRWTDEGQRPATPRSRAARRLFGASAEAALITLLVFGLIAGTTLAAPGGGGRAPKGGGGSISMVVLDGTDGVANHGERVAFEVTTTATDRPFVGVRCWQGAAFVLDMNTGYFPTYMFEPWVTLDSAYWVADQPATCTARLFYYDRRGNQKVLATTDFPAAP